MLTVAMFFVVDRLLAACVLGSLLGQSYCGGQHHDYTGSGKYAAGKGSSL